MEDNTLSEINNKWTCPNCGQINNNAFCSKCGQKRPSNDINPMNELQNLIEDTPSNNISQNTTNNTTSNKINPMDELQDLVKEPILKTTIPKRHHNSKTEENNILKYIIIGIILIIIVFAGIYILHSDNNNTTDKKTVTTTTTTSNAEENKKDTNVTSDLSLGELELGYSIDQMHNILGKETSIDDKGMYKFYNYSDIQVGIKNNKIDALVSNSSAVKTKRGIHQGSTLQDVLDKYGDNYYKTDYNDLILYEYTFAANDNQNGILRFAINKSNNLVNYISVRIPDNTNANTNTDAINEAKQTLNNYYIAITKHDMREAYNILSADMQTHMGSLDVYADGYKTTLSDEISNVQVTSNSENEIAFSYTLISRDNYNNNNIKEQTFACTALLSKKTGTWHIINMSAKKQGERIISK
ncbi:zinc ribbon domain-containing protein [Megamonas hypermegale]|uniref:zinc ribbon domain-containing protein n=1 Tax=Megamonas hypermegale TaxID=158847 RepID=UPI001959A3FD|nr:zinc ribbon domain-containing protein [Megamonas hypermegale]MBM6833890.1 hypothetical protein [Megamonas hypermegale]